MNDDLPPLRDGQCPVVITDHVTGERFRCALDLKRHNFPERVRDCITEAETLDQMDLDGLVTFAENRGWGERQFTDGVSIPVAWLEQALRVQLRRWLAEEARDCHTFEAAVAVTPPE